SLDLEPGVGPARQLQLPQVGAVLEPAAKRDPGSGEPVVAAVVVDREEAPRRCELSKRREVECLVDRELQLSLEGLLSAHLAILTRRRGGAYQSGFVQARRPRASVISTRP